MTSSTDLRRDPFEPSPIDPVLVDPVLVDPVLVDPFPRLDELPMIDLSPTPEAGIERAARAAGFEEGRRSGFRQGHFEGAARGRAEGNAEGRIEASERARSALAALDAAAQELRARDVAALESLADDVVELVMGLATSILAREVEADAEPARSAIRRALQLAPDRGPLRARLHPDDLDAIGDVADLRQLDPADRPIEVVADSTVERGGCVLEAGPCRIDAQIGAALARARAAMVGLGGDTEPMGAPVE